MRCRACELEHSPTVRCEVAARIRAAQERSAIAEMMASSPVVANMLVANAAVVANMVANNPPVVANAVVANAKPRSGDRHRKTGERRAYMRELMRQRRAAGIS